MRGTGERYIPTEQGRIRLEHYHRYAMVLDLVVASRMIVWTLGAHLCSWPGRS